MIAYTSALSVAIERAPPTTSAWPLFAAREVGTRRSAATAVAAASGTLIRKVSPQPWPLRIQPGRSGPTAIAIPEVADQAVIAAARSRLGKMAPSSDSVAGMISAAPAPITARAAISSPALLAWLPQTAAAAKTASPQTSISPA
jgi:hypothetical protein